MLSYKSPWDTSASIHGRFYQPPRENPSLEAIEMQDSGYPVTIEMSGLPPSAITPMRPRILDSEGRIRRIEQADSE